MVPSLATVLPDQLFIYALLHSESLAQSLLHSVLSSDRYVLTALDTFGSLLHITEHQPSAFDCLIVQDDPAILTVVRQLYEQEMLFPVVIVKANTNNSFDHPAAVEIDIANFSQIESAIAQAIAQFLNLSIAANTDFKNQNLLLKQQQLAKKVPAQHGFGGLGGYYKQENQHFFQQMPPENQQAFLQELQLDYRQILINYFAADRTLNQKIEQFIDKAFCTNIPVTKIIEIHMELIDEFSKQLKLEGRSDEILLDYRLTLIDILAHLCEVYRSAIPRQL